MPSFRSLVPERGLAGSRQLVASALEAGAVNEYRTEALNHRDVGESAATLLGLKIIIAGSLLRGN